MEVDKTMNKRGMNECTNELRFISYTKKLHTQYKNFYPRHFPSTETRTYNSIFVNLNLGLLILTSKLLLRPSLESVDPLPLPKLCVQHLLPPTFSVNWSGCFPSICWEKTCYQPCDIGI